MISSILAFLKVVAEILGIAKYFYQETRDTLAEKESKLEQSIEKEKDKVKQNGRPKWD